MKQLPVKAPSRDELVESLSVISEDQQNYLATLPPQKLQKIQRHVSSMRHGLQAVAPLVCMGPEKCVFVQHCPIPPTDEQGMPIFRGEQQVYGDIKDYPVGRSCVMESLYIQQKTIDYVQHLDVDPGNPVEMSIVNELALLDLMKNRALMILAGGDKRGQGRDFLMQDVTGFSDSGSPTTTTQLHPAADYIDKIEKRRERWLERLVETRKSKIDAAHKLGNVATENNLVEELKQVRAALESLKGGATAIDQEDVLEISLDD